MIAIIIIRVIILFNNILAPQKDRKCIFTQISWGLFYLFGDWHDITTWGRYRKRQAGGVEAPTERNPNHQLVTMGMPMKHWWNFNGQDIHHLLVTCGFRHFYHRFEKGHLAIFKGRVTLGHIPCPPLRARRFRCFWTDPWPLSSTSQRSFPLESRSMQLGHVGERMLPKGWWMGDRTGITDITDTYTYIYIYYDITVVKWNDVQQVFGPVPWTGVLHGLTRPW